MRLVVQEGTPLRVAVDHRVIITRVDQPIEGVLVDPVFAYDRIVIPAGTRVLGHVAQRMSVSGKRRLLAMLSGDFTPLHDTLLAFDTLILSDGRRWQVGTHVSAGTDRVRLAVADGAEKKGDIVSSAAEEAVQQGKAALAVLKGPDKAERMKDTGLRALPYHPEFFSKGTVFNARLLSALDFGTATPAVSAEPGSVPAPASVLAARLSTPVDSAHAMKGTPVEAVVTCPVFSATHQILVPAGARLAGHVTFVRRARHFRRTGQLRFLFDTIHVLGRESATMLASLHAIETGSGDRIAIDDEGGTKVTNSPARFVAPALGTLALVGLSRGHLDYDTDGAGPEMQYGGALSGSVAGLLGASITGLLMSSLGHPAAVVLGVVGVARSTYNGVIAKGREVAFPVDTRIQVQLAPGHATPELEPARDPCLPIVTAVSR
ncbi:MAG TPA: hypothetical protein VH458_15635 [Vicinamibacterales bacterium]